MAFWPIRPSSEATDTQGMTLSKQFPPALALVVIAIVTASAPTASAHTLKKKRAVAAASSAIKTTALRTSASTAKLVRCTRRGQHRFKCSAYYAYARSPGAPACVSTVVVRLRKRGKRVRTSQSGMRCGQSSGSTPGGSPGTPGTSPGTGTGNGGGGGSSQGVRIVCNDSTIVFLTGPGDGCSGHGGVLIGPPLPSLP